MLVEFSKGGLIAKAKSQPDKVKQVLDKIKTDGLLPTLETVFKRLDEPMPLGYCNVGEVIEVGSGVNGLKLGDRVVSNGSHAEIVCVPKNLCAKIPDDVSDEEVTEACKAVGLHHFIQTLPSGYETVLNDSVALSEGQKQLVTIARAMIQNAPLLILDEATSSVDTRTERIVQAAMGRLTEGRTSFVIAHRLSTIKNADTILVMNEGDIVEQGRHEELIKADGFYADLYNAQFDTLAD